MNKFIKQLKKMKACNSALDWIREREIDSVEEFWKVSDRSDWMLWLVRYEYPNVNIDIRILREIALEFTIMALPYTTYKKQLCIDCIYAAYQYFDGQIDFNGLKKYRDAVSALSVVYGAYDATHAAAFDSNSASEYAFYTIYAADATAYAASASAVATSSPANFNRQKMYKWQADVIRQYVPTLEIE